MSQELTRFIHRPSHAEFLRLYHQSFVPYYDSGEQPGYNEKKKLDVDLFYSNLMKAMAISNDNL